MPEERIIEHKVPREDQILPEAIAQAYSSNFASQYLRVAGRVLEESNTSLWGGCHPSEYQDGSFYYPLGFCGVGCRLLQGLDLDVQELCQY